MATRIALALLLAAGGVNGHGHRLLKSSIPKCVFFETAAETRLRVNYEFPDIGHDRQSSGVTRLYVQIHQYRPRRSGLPLKNLKYDPKDRETSVHEVYETKGWIPVVATYGGRLEVCVTASGATGLRPVRVSLRVTEDDAELEEELRKVIEDQEAAKQQLHVVSASIRQLIRKVEATLAFSRLARRIDSEKQEEILIENKKIKWYPICQLIVVFLTGLIQARVMALFFRKNYISC